jgi:nitrate/TMAO reductase-like tetraheme cytochrome c subunit
MSESNSTPAATEKAPSLLQNWLSLSGIILSACAFLAVLGLIGMDLIQPSGNPYMGILTYLVAPGFLCSGLALIILGALLERRRRHRLAPGEVPRHLRIDFNLPSHRRNFTIVTTLTVVFAMMTAFGSYQTYQYTESVQFCGLTCHSVMKPEYTAYQESPHARVTCSECHIGAGATWFVRSKLSGSYQVYAVLANKYERPIPTPVANLRPAPQTCGQCHWPEKFFGAVEKTHTHFMSDEKNSPWTIRMLIKVGGGDPEQGPVGGIHWHMNVANKIEYIAADEQRQKIPWIRATDRQGHVTIYESKEGKLTADQVSQATPRRMDCIDCHNRPTHIFHAPEDSVDQAMALGRIDPAMPSVKKNAVAVLTQDYATENEAVAKIAASIKKQYASFPDQAKVGMAIEELQKIYRGNFFPEMKTNWKSHPDNIGHMKSVGCFRCHDDQHVDATGKKITADCNSCHTIIAQGVGTELKTVSAQGLEFQHPSEDLGDAWKGMKCTECHNGGPMP